MKLFDDDLMDSITAPMPSAYDVVDALERLDQKMEENQKRADRINARRFWAGIVVSILSLVVATVAAIAAVLTLLHP